MRRCILANNYFANLCFGVTVDATFMSSVCSYCAKKKSTGYK